MVISMNPVAIGLPPSAPPARLNKLDEKCFAVVLATILPGSAILAHSLI